MTASLSALQASGHLRRADAALGEWLARAYPDSEPAVALAAALAARAIADGHSALELARAQTWLVAMHGDGRALVLPDVDAWSDALRRSSAVLADGDAGDLRPLVLDAQGRVYLRRYYEYERQLARTLIDRTRHLPLALRASLPPPLAGKGRGGGEWIIDSDQQRAIDVALTHRFTLVTGGPGTGKTHGVMRMLAALAQQAHARGEALRIALAAPTGKAAARLREALLSQVATLDIPEIVAAMIPRDADTLHRLLGLSPWRASPRFDRTAPLPFDIVVADEVSMIDLPLMAKLVDAVRPEARLTLLGDPDQLSAVEAGNVLGALVDAAREAPLADCHIALTRSHRFGAGSALDELARAIAAGDTDRATAACERGEGVALADGTRLAHAIEAASAAYSAVLDASDPAAALHAARRFRLLTALRHGPSGCLALDGAIAQHLQRERGVRADERWWQGRLILVTANRPELGLFNGDTGVVWPDTDGVLKAWFDGADGAPRALPVAALPPHEGAFALTVHKAQGSEFDQVALVTGPDSAVLTRELLYTGVTRARAGIVLYSTPETLQRGIANRTLRMTGLADRLREAAGT